MKRWALPVFVLCLVASVPAAWGAYADALIADVPHVRQKPDFCGEACAQMWLSKLGKPWTQDQVFTVSGLSPALGRGCYTAELRTALTRIGFVTGDVFYTIQTAKAQEQLEAQFAALHADLARGIPSVVCMHYEDKPTTSEHFRLVLGYDAKKDELIYHEPALDRAPYQRLARATFMKLWPLKVDDRTSSVIRIRLEPGKLADPPATVGFTPADYAQHVLALKAKMPRGFSVVVEPPFVVVGDEPPATVQRRSTDTVRWAVEKLKKDYFTKDPADILTIWLFKDKESYDKYTKEIFNDTPNTPYGYYSDAHKALIMNIQTGGGTLVHEIVHPFMHTNFPECPAWFNEGMGSLYEQCGDQAGHIHGYTNWRLPGLQQAIGKKTVPSFKTFTDMDDADFYNRDRGTNYAQARYLCYYLQEQGLLVKFYQQFTASKKDDPTGYRTLQKVLAKDDMDAFKKDWEAFVMKLKFE